MGALETCEQKYAGTKFYFAYFTFILCRHVTTSNFVSTFDLGQQQ